MTRKEQFAWLMIGSLVTFALQQLAAGDASLAMIDLLLAGCGVVAFSRRVR